MVEIKLIGLGCSKSWKMEDKLIRLSREVGVPVQIIKVMDLDKIIDLEVQNIPALLNGEEVWTYDDVMDDDILRRVLMRLNSKPISS